MTTRSRQAWSTAVGFGLAVVVAISPLVGVLRADAAEGGVATAVSSPGLAAAGGSGTDSVYIDDSLQAGNLTDHWDLKGDRWTPQLMTVAQTNQIERSSQTEDCWDMLVGSNQRCQAAYASNYDGNWLTLTSDNTQNGLGEAGFVLNKNVFASDLGVVVEYDQRVFRANNGNRPLQTDPIQYGGDGISMFLVDATPSNFGESAVRTVLGDPGGYGAGLGYSSVSSAGGSWCPAQQGIAGAYLGIGFDVYGNFQKAEDSTGVNGNPATRPNSISGSNNSPTLGLGLNKRVPQSIGLRGSGVRFTTTPTCGTGDLERAYGMLTVPEINNAGFVTFYSPIWNGGSVSNYRFQYLTSDNVWHNWYTPEVSTRGGTTSGYMQARVPSSAKPIKAFAFQYGTTGTYREVATPSGDGIVTAHNAFQVLGAKTGGYRWLNGTPAHGYSANTAGWIDNAIADATDYRRVRITITPNGTTSREVVVSWSDKLDMTGDVCVNPDTKLPNGLTGSNCSGTNGEWRHNGTVTFTEQFRYDLTGSSYQAPLPDEFRLGFAASTGWAVNFHQIRNLRVTSVVDLEIEKYIAGGTGTPWGQTHTARVGDTVKYQLAVRNNGLDTLDADFPSTITDGLGSVPLSGVTWTATATGGAQVRTNGGTWETEVTGTGPITGTTLEWWGPPVAPSADPQVTVEITGTVTAPVAFDTDIPNTARVATSTIGGPQDENPANNTSTANLKVVQTPIWRILKESTPVSGSVVAPLDTITYTVTATGDVLPITDVVLTDDLSDVLDEAEFVAGSAKLKIGSGADILVADPVGPATSLVTAPFTLPAGTDATLTYQVIVKADAHGAALKNVVTGSATTIPPATCADPATAGSDTRCYTEHTTLELVDYFIQKTDIDGVGRVGAEFKLLLDDAGAPGLEVPDVTLTPVAGTAGLVSIEGLGDGTYWLQETKAPTGHVLLAQPVKFTVLTGKITLATPNTHGTAVTVTADGLTITVVDQPAYVLPLTGGHGNGPFILGGIVLMTIAAGLWGGAELRRRRLRPGVATKVVTSETAGEVS